MNLERDWHKNPGNFYSHESSDDYFQEEEIEHKQFPLWFYIMLVAGLIYAIYACFLWGVEDGKSAARNKIIQSRIEAMKHPIKYASADEINATVWELIQERVQSTSKGDSK